MISIEMQSKVLQSNVSVRYTTFTWVFGISLVPLKCTVYHVTDVCMV